MKLPVVVSLLLAGTCLAQTSMPIYKSNSFAVFSDRVVEGKYSAHAVSAKELQSNYSAVAESGKSSEWKLTTDVSEYPQLDSGFPIIDATYNLSLEELKRDVRPDGTFMAGAKWDGVWTRDISYSILLSLAVVEPDIAKASLMRKVKRERIVQDTGTGGSWPVSTDRMTWALAAWEVYKVTGDRDWLRQSYNIIRNSIKDDETVAFSTSGLARGESSFLDWREQTYPRWMQPVDIFEGQALGTNAVFYRTYRILRQMARILDEPANDYDQKAERIREAINRKLWMDDKGYYGQYLYGRASMSLSPRSEALGEAFAILFDIAEAEQQRKVLSSVPLLEYGVPCIYPQIPGIPPYHNRAIWPFVQAFWNLAAAKQHNGTALLHGMASIYRSSALFLTNKENMVADSGSPLGTEINSDRQLWSVAGNLAMAYRVLFGLNFEEDGLRVSPVIPRELAGVHRLTNLHYRNALLSIRVEGFGTTVKSMTLDGQPVTDALPTTLAGKHELVVLMANDELERTPINLVSDLTAPDTPIARIEGRELKWEAIPGAARYFVHCNGRLIATTMTPAFTIPEMKGMQEYQIAASDSAGNESFLSEPLTTDANAIRTALNSSNVTAAAPVEISHDVDQKVLFRLSLQKAGLYRIQFHYANGSGPVNTDNKCAIRTLFVDGEKNGTVVFPQRGTGEWSNWGLSSANESFLKAGEHEFVLRFQIANENMNGEVNRAVIESVYLVPISVRSEQQQ